MLGECTKIRRRIDEEGCSEAGSLRTAHRYLCSAAAGRPCRLASGQAAACRYGTRDRESRVPHRSSIRGSDAKNLKEPEERRPAQQVRQ
jgi:hypothetical protein